MMKKKLCLLCFGLVLLVTGCAEKKTVTEKTSAEITEIPELIPFRPETVEEKESMELPRAYSYKEEKQLPKIRNQEGSNTCWAFAALSALESSKDEDVQDVYSVEHLLVQNPFGTRFEDGGAYIVTMAYLLSWKGPVLEEADSYDAASLKKAEPVVHVQEVRLSEPKDYDAIKRFVYLYGGVESALYLDFNEYISESECYDAETNAYCYLGEKTSNHDIVIVGWDDDYPAENFQGNVTSDGAFLCQNSWGIDFGDKGIFYVSYEDVNIGGYGVVYSRVDRTDHYDRIYQSDLCGYTAQIGYQQETAWFSNVYTAEEDILLRAAGFYATGKDTEYEIYFVPEFQNEGSFEDMQLLTAGKLEDAGYYTIDFQEPVKTDAKSRFAVVVKIKTKNAEYPVAVECPVEGLSENADVTDGQGYLSFQGQRWEHVEATKNYNICLKVYADLQ